MRKKHEEAEPGVLKLFRINAPHYSKRRKQFLPLILKVRLTKGAQPVFVNYQTMRQQYYSLLLQYFEQKVMFRNMDEQMPADLQYDHSSPAPHRQYAIEAKDLYQLKKQQSANHHKRKGKREKKEPSKDKDSDKRSQSLDARPMRSCRLRSDHSKVKQEAKDDPHISNQANSNQEEPQPQVQQPAVQQPSYPVNQRKVVVLDYDNLVESEGRQSLISPAVIPSTKIRQEIMAPPPPVTYPLTARIPYAQIQRDQFSSEQFKESEESEFVLDQRGKQKRKRQKLLREQEKMKRGKKYRRIKKKNKPARH